MPLSEKARIEVYLPEQPKPAYRRLLDELREEFSYTFGGATVINGLDGSYMSRAGAVLRDRVNLIYADAPFSVELTRERVSCYAEWLRQAAFEALEEEAALVAVFTVYHAE